jgi:transcriptional regulator with XRE-family HTH domain
MRQIFTEAEFKDFVHSLRTAIQRRKLTITAAARVLGVTRQMLHLYLGGSRHQPRWRVIERACRAWDISFVAQGKKFDRRAFGEEKKPAKVRDSAVQLMLLPEAIECLQDANLDVRIIRRDASRVFLEVQVRFAG